MDILSLMESNFVGLLIGISGIVLAIIFYFKSKKSKKPIYFLRTFDIAKKDEAIPKLKLTYEDHPVETLSITRIAILNNGNETIRSEDVAKSDPLRIEISKNFKILDANFHYIRNEANGFSLEPTEDLNIIKINFDYIDGGDGCIIQVIHDGAAAEDVSVGGSVKGAGEIIQGSSKREIREIIILVIPPLLITFFIFLFPVIDISRWLAGLPVIILDYGYSPSWAVYGSGIIWFIVILVLAILFCIVFYLCIDLNVKFLNKFFKDHIYFYESKM